MSLITVEDDSSDEMAIDSNAGENSDTDSIGSNEKLSTLKNDAANSIDTCIDEQSCNVKTVENGCSQDKPILELMKHLINYNGKQNTTLTNAQLIGILRDEFKIDVTNLHYISVDIYMNVLKKFLKDWPQWDEFDRVMHESRCMNDNEEIEKMLESEYHSLKEYLAAMLKACKPWAREAAQRVKRCLEIPASSRSEPGDVILEVNCTRKQLNTLFFRKPHPDFNFTIFNVDNALPTKICIKNVPLSSILNWSHMNVTVNLNCFKYKRELVHEYKHTLVNKKLNQHVLDTELNRHLQTIKPSKKEQTITSNDVNSIANAILHTNKFSIDQQCDIEDLFNIIVKDVSVTQGSFSIPSTFRHYMNPHRYVRYLYKDVDTENDRYDIQLEERVSPRLKFQISKVCFETNPLITDIHWLKMECTLCGLIYVGVAGIEQLKTHFREAHHSESDWLCMNCEETFSVGVLSSSRWYHECANQDDVSASDLSD